MPAPKSLRKSDIGKVLVIRFWDHTEGDATLKLPIFTEAIGRLLSYDKRSLLLRSWDTPEDRVGDATSNDSKKHYVILRSCVTEIVRCKELAEVAKRTITVVDRASNPVPRENLRPSAVELLEDMESDNPSPSAMYGLRILKMLWECAPEKPTCFVCGAQAPHYGYCADHYPGHQTALTGSD